MNYLFDIKSAKIQNTTVILISLLGQTCSGKSEMAVEIARWLGNCCIINCDSRQIYQKLNIGTGKIKGSWKDNNYFYKTIPHLLIDYVDPQEKNYSLANYINDFKNLQTNIESQFKYAILTGGTGLYAKAITDNYQISSVKPEYEKDWQDLRKELSKDSISTLQQKYLTLNLSPLNHSDFHNPRRLISKLLDFEGKSKGWYETIQNEFKFDKSLNFAIQVDQTELKQKILIRLKDRVTEGLTEEIESLNYLGTQRLLDLGLEYRISQLYLLGFLTEDEWINKMYLENCKYAKRQLTWLQKQDFTWISNTEETKRRITSAI